MTVDGNSVLFGVPLQNRRKVPYERINPAAASDIREQPSKVVYRGFIAKTPGSRLQSFPRYLKAIW